VNVKRWIAITALTAATTISFTSGAAQSRRQPMRPEQPVRPDEARIMAVIEKLTPQIGPMLSVPPDDGRFLRIMAESIGAKNVVEIGTSNGYSALWMSMALKNTGGKLTTFDIDPEKVKMARVNFKEAGVDGFITVVEGDAHQKIKDLKGPIDMVFIDAEKEGYADYLKQLLPLVRPGGLILAHNVTGQRRQMQDFIEAITTNPDLATAFANPTDRGMSVTLKKSGEGRGARE
jgi:caffeoyl-CoA O-methyltransferase